MGAEDAVQAFDARSEGFAGKLQTHLAEQREVLSTFNIAFFGRTGAGKSTLLSAFGELDGSAVSPGESDWTVETHSVSWRGCKLFDTPGITGIQFFVVALLLFDGLTVDLSSQSSCQSCFTNRRWAGE
jgi:tRNA U34 5-carboxymethylaminomethyl modifying GTPase MnmE/TrmE